MALIYLKGAENTCILAPREMTVRPFNFGAWTEMRMGIFFTMVTAAGDDANAVNETVVIASALDYMAFGIKTNNTTPARTAGTDFIGLMNQTAQSSLLTAGAPGNLNSAGNPRGVYLNDAAVLSEATNLGQADFPQAAGAAGYNGFLGLRFVITNLGLVNQQINLGFGIRSSVAGVDYSVTALRTQILSGGSTGYTMGGPRDWNTGVVARVVPDAFYVRMPFFNNRIRMSAMEMIKVA